MREHILRVNYFTQAMGNFIPVSRFGRLTGALSAATLAIAGFSAEVKALSVGTFTDAQQLVDALLVTGWSAVPGSIVLTEALGPGGGSVGFFNEGSSSIGLNSGVILTSGLIANAPGPNNDDGATGGGSMSSLSFDVVAPTSSLSWQYVFASEEYEEYVGSQFNDIFTLSVNGTNIALIPDTTTPVSVNTVNQSTNSSFYLSNSPPNSTPQPFPGTQYDGFTVPLLATATGLVPGNTYSLNFMVSDTGDTILDSAVFIAANSVSFPGGSPEDPLIPPSPATPQDPWVFPPIAVVPGQTFWFDPLVSIGYIFNIASSSAPTLFDTFSAPILPFNNPSNPYQLYSDGGACSSDPDNYSTLIGLATPGTPFDFTTDLGCFAIKGISEENLLDPINTNAFIWGASFSSSATINVTQLPITTDFNPGGGGGTSSVPAPLPILGGAVVLRSLRKLRTLSSRLKAS
jgi:hypothetical protein